MNHKVNHPPFEAESQAKSLYEEYDKMVRWSLQQQALGYNEGCTGKEYTGKTRIGYFAYLEGRRCWVEVVTSMTRLTKTAPA